MRRRLPVLAVLVVVAALVAALVVSQAARRRAGNELSGTTEAFEVRVAARVSARVLEVRCEEGRQVAAGETLMVLDPADYRNAELAALAQVRAAEANRSATAARAALAGATLGRMERLHAAGGISQQEMDRARAEAQAAGDALAAARTAVEAALAQRELALARFADCAITAPVAGTVAALVFRQGETVFPGAVVATIVDLSQTWLVGYLPERLLGRVRLGDTCRVRVDAYPQRTFDGVVSFIADRAEFTPRDIQTREERVNQVYRMKVTLANPERVFKPGMPADVRLLLR